MRKWGTIGTILLLCLALLSATSCGGTQEETTQQLIDVVRGDLIVSVSGSGNIVASDEANLVFGTSGKITRIYVDEGDKVSEGEVLARLETGPLELALTQAQVALTGQELAVSQAEVNVKNAEIALERAEDSWLDTKSAGSKVKRLKKYLEYHLENHPEDTAEILSIQRSLREAWERFLLVATDSVDSRQVTAKEMELELAKQSVEQMKHSLEQFRQAVAEAQKQLDEATIHAPFGGVVASIDAEEGDISFTKSAHNLGIKTITYAGNDRSFLNFLVNHNLYYRVTLAILANSPVRYQQNITLSLKDDVSDGTHPDLKVVALWNIKTNGNLI